jgi:hypothetical protein
MITRATPAGRSFGIPFVLVLLAVLAAGLLAAGTAAASGPAAGAAGPQQWMRAPGTVLVGQVGAALSGYGNGDTYRFVASKTVIAAAKASVNWRWLLLGIGGAVLLLVVMWFLRRRIERKGRH